jgi:hypothetical protein
MTTYMIGLQLVPAQFRSDRRRDLMKKADFKLKDHYIVAFNKTLNEAVKVVRDIETQHEEWKNDEDGILAEDENFYLPEVSELNYIPIYTLEVYTPVAVSVRMSDYPDYVWESGPDGYWRKNN